MEVFVQFDKCMRNCYMYCFSLVFKVIVSYINFQVVNIFYFNSIERIYDFELNMCLWEVIFLVMIVYCDFIIFFGKVNLCD